MTDIMQTLGLSESTPRTEGRLKSLLWPTIHNNTDLEYVTEQGFWICSIVSVVTLGMTVSTGSRVVSLFGLFEATFYFLGGVGVRQRNRFAAVAVFAAYLGGTLLKLAMTGVSLVNQAAMQGSGGIIGIIILALLLANVRGIWQASKWQPTEDDPPSIRLNETFKDKFADQMPQIVWPRLRILFYVLSGIELLLILLAGLGIAIQLSRH
jgi:hypothetical protein